MRTIPSVTETIVPWVRSRSSTEVFDLGFNQFADFAWIQFAFVFSEP